MPSRCICVPEKLFASPFSHLRRLEETLDHRERVGLPGTVLRLIKRDDSSESASLVEQARTGITWHDAKAGIGDEGVRTDGIYKPAAAHPADRAVETKPGIGDLPRLLRCKL